VGEELLDCKITSMLAMHPWGPPVSPGVSNSSVWFLGGVGRKGPYTGIFGTSISISVVVPPVADPSIGGMCGIQSWNWTSLVFPESL
jgi:hypothetical protein